MILVIDNYDSFTWNLVHYLMELGAEVEVVRNDALTAAQALDSVGLPNLHRCVHDGAETIMTPCAAQRPVLDFAGSERDLARLRV